MLANFPRIFIRLIERLCEFMGNEQSEVRVAGAKGRILVRMTVRSHYAAMILNDDMTGRIAAEGAYPCADREYCR